ncbi:unnamed protein product [Rodentolepis nana]|uniref:Serine/threonine-protein phosphatase PGAM5, mitochondrial n=1 Tax=Rodentolepis nana TaxID=102285 RepID=A0A0R3T8U0_RODNA|nr:unnamed protein product [Rodentolepis nana]
MVFSGVRFGCAVFALSASSFVGFSLLRPFSFTTTTDEPKPCQNQILWNHQWDNSDNGDRSRLKLIILVRHGQYDVKAPSSGEKVLTPLGWKQAIATGNRLRELGYKIDCIVHSNLIRARQTTAGILSQLDQVQISDTGILELTENSSSSNCDNDDDAPVRPSPLFSKSYPLLESPLLAEGPPPVEPEPCSSSRKKYVESLSGSELAERIEMQNQIYSSFQYHIHRRSINEYLPPAFHVKQPVEVILFVGHANVFRYWLCRALQLPPEAWLRISLPHGSITELLVEASAEKKTCTVVALRIGDDGHMPIELISR